MTDDYYIDSDLARIVGVGPVFARILYEAGADSLEAFVTQSPDELLAKTQEVIVSRGTRRETSGNKTSFIAWKQHACYRRLLSMSEG